MITAYFVKKIAEDNPDKYWYRIVGDNVIDKESNQVVGSLDAFVPVLRKKMYIGCIKTEYLIFIRNILQFLYPGLH